MSQDQYNAGRPILKSSSIHATLPPCFLHRCWVWGFAGRFSITGNLRFPLLTLRVSRYRSRFALTVWLSRTFSAIVPVPVTQAVRFAGSLCSQRSKRLLVLSLNCSASTLFHYLQFWISCFWFGFPVPIGPIAGLPFESFE